MVGNRYAGYAVHDMFREEIGEVQELFVDENGRPEYVSVRMGSPGPNVALIPLDVACADGQRRLIEVLEPREKVEGAPTFDGLEEVTSGFEQRVRSFFGVENDGKLEAPSTDWLVPFLLLGLRERRFHGQDLARRMIYLGFVENSEEATYRALVRMAEEGMVFSEPDIPGHGPSRPRYSVTELGEAYLEFWSNSLTQYREEIDLFLKLYGGWPGTNDRDGDPRARG